MQRATIHDLPLTSRELTRHILGALRATYAKAISRFARRRRDTLHPLHTAGKHNVDEQPHFDRFPHPMDTRAGVRNASTRDVRLWLPRSMWPRPNGILFHVRIADTPGARLPPRTNKWTVRPTMDSLAHVHT